MQGSLKTTRSTWVDIKEKNLKTEPRLANEPLSAAFFPSLLPADKAGLVQVLDLSDMEFGEWVERD